MNQSPTAVRARLKMKRAALDHLNKYNPDNSLGVVIQRNRLLGEIAALEDQENSSHQGQVDHGGAPMRRTHRETVHVEVPGNPTYARLVKLDEGVLVLFCDRRRETGDKVTEREIIADVPLGLLAEHVRRLLEAL